MQENRSDSNDMDSSQNRMTLGVKFGGKMTQEKIDEKISEYTRQGWSILVDANHIGFLSPCGRWYNSFDKTTGFKFVMDKKWIENMRMVRKEVEEA
jgi:hypothetical protein